MVMYSELYDWVITFDDNDDDNNTDDDDDDDDADDVENDDDDATHKINKLTRELHCLGSVPVTA